MKKFLKSQAGMTLLELLVVIAILGGIAAFAAVNIFGAKDKAEIDNTKIQIREVIKALKIYKMDNYSYPSTEQGLEALVTKPSAGKPPKNYREGGYMDKIPEDAWGNPYGYASPGRNGNPVEIWSFGPDGEEDTDDDIKSWELDQKEEAN